MKKFIIALCLSFVTILSFSQQVVGQRQSAIRIQMTSEDFYLSNYDASTNTDYFYNESLNIMYGCWYDYENSNYCYQLGMTGNDDTIIIYNEFIGTITNICYYNGNGLYLNYSTSLAHWFNYNEADGIWQIFSTDMRYVK